MGLPGSAVWEVDGADNKLFGQNLSLFAKLFLEKLGSVKKYHTARPTVADPPRGIVDGFEVQTRRVFEYVHVVPGA